MYHHPARCMSNDQTEVPGRVICTWYLIASISADRVEWKFLEPLCRALLPGRIYPQQRHR